MTKPRQRRSYETGMRASPASLRRATGSALGFFVVLFNLVATLSVGPVRLDTRVPAVDPALAETARVLGQSIVICTPSGMLTIGADGKPVGPAQGGHSGLCAFCLPFLAGTCAAPAAAAHVAYAATAEPIEARPQLIGWAISRIRTWTGVPRAPPAA